MKCYYHPSRDAVAQCVQCSKGLCMECAQKWEPPHCDSCGTDIRVYAKRRMLIIKAFGVGGFLGSIFCALLCAGVDDTSSALAYLLLIPILTYESAALPAGWWKLSNFTSRFFLFLPIIGWLIYFGIKLFLANILGIFVLPGEYIRLKRILKD